MGSFFASFFCFSLLNNSGWFHECLVLTWGRLEKLVSHPLENFLRCIIPFPWMLTLTFNSLWKYHVGYFLYEIEKNLNYKFHFISQGWKVQLRYDRRKTYFAFMLQTTKKQECFLFFLFLWQEDKETIVWMICSVYVYICSTEHKARCGKLPS